MICNSNSWSRSSGKGKEEALNKISVAVSLFHPSSSFTTILFMCRGINERNEKNLVRLYLYICVVCVCQYMYEFYIYEYVIGSVWHSWQVADVILLLHSGCCTFWSALLLARYQR